MMAMSYLPLGSRLVSLLIQTTKLNCNLFNFEWNLFGMASFKYCYQPLLQHFVCFIFTLTPIVVE